MKKLITGILATLSCLTFMAGCVVADQSSSTPNTDSSPIASDTGSTSTPDANAPLAGLNDAKDFLYLKMKDDANTATAKDYKIVNTCPGENDETYTVTVSVDVTSGVTVKAGDTEWTVDIDSALEEDLAYKLTVEISDGTNKVSFTLDRTAKANPIVPVAITTKPVEGTAYKLWMYQVTKHADEYFNGELDKQGFYLYTSTSHEYAKDVYVDYVDGSETDFNLYMKDGEAKKYIGVYNSFNSKGYHLTPTINATINNFEHVTSKEGWTTSNTFFGGSYVFTWNETHGTFVTSIANAKYAEYDAATNSPLPENVTAKTVTAFLGTSGTYYTFGGMDVEALKNNDTCVGKLVQMIDKRTLTAEEKVAFEAAYLKKAFTFTGAIEETLPVASTFSDVTVTWTVEGDATVVDGVLKMDEPVADTTLTLKAVIACGADASQEVEATVTVYVPPVPLSIPDALAIAEDDLNEKKYIFEGIVTQIASTTYGNLYITDDAGNTIYVYGLYDGKNTENDGKGNRYDAMGDNKPVLGDKLTLVSTIGTYKGTNQLVDAILSAKSVPETVSAAVKLETTKREQKVSYEIKAAGDVTLAAAGVKYTDVTITWESNNPTLAAVNGNVVTYTIPETDTKITLTATFICGGDATTATTKTFSVTVKAPVLGAELSFADSKNRTSKTNDGQVWEANGVKLTTSSSNDFTNPVRIYKNATSTVEYADGMNNIVFNCNSASYATALYNALVKDTSITVTVTEKVVKVVFAAEKTSYEFNTSEGQVRIDSIIVS